VTDRTRWRARTLFESWCFPLGKLQRERLYTNHQGDGGRPRCLGVLALGDCPFQGTLRWQVAPVGGGRGKLRRSASYMGSNFDNHAECARQTRRGHDRTRRAKRRTRNSEAKPKGKRGLLRDGLTALWKASEVGQGRRM
jgi:hypothetical protein